MRIEIVVTVIGALIASSCGGEEESQSTTAPAAESSGSEAPDRRTQMRDHMETNFRLATDARDALIHGNLAKARASAKELAFHDHRGVLPERWMDDVQRMQDAAEDVATATDLDAAGRGLAELASSCGDCHKRLNYAGDDAAVEHGLSPQGSESVRERMLRHQLAADKLWYGLTIPSDAAWLAGARALTEAPLAPLHEGEHEVSRELHARMEEVVGLGRSALEAESREQRSEVYARLLSSCANCHSE